MSIFSIVPNPEADPSPTLETTNPHSQRHKEFDNTRLFKRLADKHTPKPYWKAYRGIHNAVSGVSLLFNALSALTASALVYFFILGLTSSPLAAGVLTITLLGALEYMKRETAAKLFHGWLQFKTAAPGMIAAVLSLSAISTAASYFGAEATVKNFTAPPEIAAADITDIEGRMAQIDEQIASAQKNQWRGIMTPRAQKTVELLTAERGRLQEEALRRQERADMQADEIMTEHESEMEINSGAFALFTLISEISLILCLFYMQYYDFRSYSEYAMAKKGESATGRGTEQNYRNAPGYDYGGGGNARNGTERAGTHNKIGFEYGKRTERTNETKQRTCTHCGTPYVYGHARQRFCSDQCRITNWKQLNGKDVTHF